MKRIQQLRICELGLSHLRAKGPRPHPMREGCFSAAAMAGMRSVKHRCIFYLRRD